VEDDYGRSFMRVALVQEKWSGSKEVALKKSSDAVRKAAANGAELVVLQELHQGPYFCQHEDVELFNLAESFEEDVKFWSSVA